MARSTAQIIDALAPSVRRAFIASMRDLTSSVNLGLFTKHLKAGDIELAIHVLNIGPEFFGPLDKALRDAYALSGAELLGQITALGLADPITGGRVVARFGTGNPRAEQFLRDQSSKLITVISDQTKDLAREILREGLAAGRSPRSVALDLVGRKGAGKGPRKGGIMGLNRPQSKAASTALEELVTGGNPSLSNYLTRKTRSKKFDRLVLQAIKSGKPIPAPTARKMISAMKDNMLRNRGEAIARSELLASVNQAQEEGLTQLVDSGKVEARHIEGEWDAAEDADVRPSHAFMDKQRQLFGTPFVSGNGNLLLMPGDRSHGAPGDEVINCRCFRRIRINFLARLK